MWHHTGLCPAGEASSMRKHGWPQYKPLQCWDPKHNFWVYITSYFISYLTKMILSVVCVFIQLWMYVAVLFLWWVVQKCLCWAENAARYSREPAGQPKAIESYKKKMGYCLDELNSRDWLTTAGHDSSTFCISVTKKYRGASSWEQDTQEDLSS